MVQTHTVKPVFKTTWEIGTTWELRAATPVPRSIQYIEMDLRNKTTSEFGTVFHSPFGVLILRFHCKYGNRKYYVDLYLQASADLHMCCSQTDRNIAQILLFLGDVLMFYQAFSVRRCPLSDVLCWLGLHVY